ncbi:16S rRNA (guanine(966)-N(2))-methyltransferase RsmD [Sphingobacterium endophyticum]|uniref:16S rRNA (guanine(966)-N(2))-methyltransferase RsmD n=1 Tax=Sphingobacterium endophyticum TaxID=2546448 RepID=UPI0012E16748|nr:16S rRNA (guanine(966)-N(2))-methyltransferase RsmD [Sphingobacterium endophyticum]
MRIIGGKAAGLRLNPPQNLPVRPTTDIAKEALFNILNNKIDFDGLECLDLFAGTGNISFELASRGAGKVTSVDLHGKCILYISETAKKLDLQQIKTRKADVFKYIKADKDKYDLIFADPPYDIGQLPLLAQMVLENNLLKEDGLLIVEHPSNRKMLEHPNYVETRQYGNSSFSFYTI